MTTHDDSPTPSETGGKPHIVRSLRRLFLSEFVLANETAYFLLASALDLFITYLLLAWPDSRAYEANPIARRILGLGLGYLIAFKFGAAAVSIVACELVARRRRVLGRIVLISLTLVVAIVCARGLRLFFHNSQLFALPSVLASNSLV